MNYPTLTNILSLCVSSEVTEQGDKPEPEQQEDWGRSSWEEGQGDEEEFDDAIFDNFDDFDDSEEDEEEEDEFDDFVEEFNEEDEYY